MKANQQIKLNILKKNIKIGELFFNPQTEKFFINLKENISPHLKNDSDSKTIENYLKNLIPEGEHLDVISLFLQVSRYNTIELIKLIGSDVTGGICFTPNDKLNTTTFYENNKIKIAPFYDIVNITLFSQSQFENELAMAIGDNFSYNLSYSDFLDLSEDINLNVDFIINRFESILNQVKNNIDNFIVNEKYISIEFFEKYKLNVVDRIDNFKTLIQEFKNEFQLDNLKIDEIEF